MKGERINRTPARHSRRTMDTDIKRATSGIEKEDKSLSIAPRQLFAGSREIDGEEALKVARVLSAQVKGMSTTGAHTFYRQILERRLAQGPIPVELQRFGDSGAEIANHIANHLSGMDLIENENLTDEERDKQMDERREFAHKLLTSHGLDEEIKKPNKLLQNQAVLGVHGAGVHTLFRSVPRYLSTSAKGFGRGMIESVLDKLTLGKVRKARNLGAYDIGQGIISELVRTKGLSKIPSIYVPVADEDIIDDGSKKPEPEPKPNPDLTYGKPGVNEQIYPLAGRRQKVQDVFAKDAANDDVEVELEPTQITHIPTVDPKLIEMYKQGLGIHDDTKQLHPGGVTPNSNKPHEVADREYREHLGEHVESNFIEFINELRERKVEDRTIKQILDGMFTSRTNRSSNDRAVNYSNFMAKTAELLQQEGHHDLAEEFNAGQRVYYPVAHRADLPVEIRDNALKIITSKRKAPTSRLLVKNNVTPHPLLLLHGLQENQEELTPLQKRALIVNHFLNIAASAAPGNGGNAENHIIKLAKKALTKPNAPTYTGTNPGAVTPPVTRVTQIRQTRT